MPKTNDAGGATYFGHDGVVEHAGGAGSTRPGGLSEVDPSRDLDGSARDGFESDEREVEDREGAGAVAEPTLLPAPEEQDAPEEEKSEEKEEVPSSRGSSSGASESSSAKTRQARTSAK